MARRFNVSPARARRLSVIFASAAAVVALGTSVAVRYAPFVTARTALPTTASSSERAAVARNAGAESAGRFRFELVSEITIYPFALAPAPGRAHADSAQHIGYHTTGILQRRPLGNTGFGSVELLSVEDPEVTQKATRSERMPAIERALARGVVVERSTAGRALRVRVPVEAGRDETDVLRQLAELTQLATMAAGTAGMTAEESSINGRLSARYEGHANDDGYALVRRIQLASASEGAANPWRSDLHGTFEATLRERAGALVELHGEQTETKTHPTGAEIARAVTRTKLTRLEDSAVLAPPENLDGFGDWIALEGPLPPPPGGQERALAVLAEQHTLDELLALQQRAEHDGDANAELERTLWAFLTVHPEACKDFGERAARGALRDAGAQAALSALFRAGHAQAQEALAAVARSWKSSPDATSVVAMFGSLSEVTPESEAFLRSVRDDAASEPELAGTAGLALASAAGRLRDRAPVRAAAVADEYETRVSHAETPLALAQGLAALGNVGSERIAELATPQLDHDDPLVRRMAIHALAVARNPEAKERVAQLAESDPDPTVREEAKLALSALGS